MKSDDVLRAIADSGGVIGMSGRAAHPLSHAHPHHTILSVMDHFLYCVDLVGIEHVAFGPDTLYGDHVQLQHVFAHMLKVADMEGRRSRRSRTSTGWRTPRRTSPTSLAGWCTRDSLTRISRRRWVAISCEPRRHLGLVIKSRRPSDALRSRES